MLYPIEAPKYPTTFIKSENAIILEEFKFDSLDLLDSFYQDLH